jgi:hypothetical protein
MACILRPPSETARGVVTFTTPERDRFILQNADLAARIRDLKLRWFIGLHHNWHDFAFRYESIFDFSMAGEGDLREANGRDFALVPLDACNFVPPEFRPGGTKFWDVLFVAHPVFFKRVPEFLATIRALYDQGCRYRVLHVCPMPPYSESEEATVLYDIRRRYDELFDDEEQDYFTLLTVDFRYPFPFDLPTLAHFYRSSRVFLHSAYDERRCRVAAYAWACGMPVVARASVGSLLPDDLRTPPYFFEAHRDSDYPVLVRRAVETAREGFDAGPARAVVAVEQTAARLSAALDQFFESRGCEFGDEPLLNHGLDIRLGRHHGIGLNPNSVPQTLDDFVRYLSERPIEAMRGDVATTDPERAIARVPGFRSVTEDIIAGLEVTPVSDAAGPEPLARRLRRRLRSWRDLTTQ